MRDIDYMIEVMQAFKDGKEIEYTLKNNEHWSINLDPAWNWNYCNYRIKKKIVKKYQIAYKYHNNDRWYLTPYPFENITKFQEECDHEDYQDIKILEFTKIEVEE